MEDALLLNADFAPMGVVAWQRAIHLVVEGKATAIETYPDRWIRSAKLRLAWPSVVYLTRYVRVRRSFGPSRRRVLARDHFQCQYCGASPTRPQGGPDLAALTVDHVVPRSRSVQGRVQLPWSGRRVRVSSWHNVVAACVACNQRKADRTPGDAGMPLQRHPTAPRPGEAVRITLARCAVPQQWQPFLGGTRAA